MFLGNNENMRLCLYIYGFEIQRIFAHKHRHREGGQHNKVFLHQSFIACFSVGLFLQ